MNRFRYDTSGTWYKGNTHIHSTASDGGKKPEELWDMYARLGYDFLVHTDHWVASEFQQRGDHRSAPLLVLDGIEISGADSTGAEYHVVCLGALRGLAPAMGFAAALESARRQGAVLILAHPHWTGNSFDDALRHKLDGVEVYNHVCWWLNGKGDAAPYWDAMLDRFPNTLGFAADDAHVWPFHAGVDGGWIVVNAPERSVPAILSAIRRGNFYSSQGPTIHSIETDGKQLRVRTSPIRIAHLCGPAWRGGTSGLAGGALVSEVALEIPTDCRYVRLQLEDEHGRRAWTNTLFFEE